MNSSLTHPGSFRPGVGKTLVAIAVASALGAFGIAPAFGDEHDNRGYDANDRSHDARPVQHYHPKVHHAPHYTRGYAPPPVYYAPAPVYYAPQPSAGINLFVPINFH